MCGHRCAKTWLFILSLFFFLLGGAVFGISLYSFIFEPLYGKSMLDDAIDAASENGAAPTLCERVELYLVVVAAVAMAWGVFVMLTGVFGMVGAYRNFKVRGRIGGRKSNLSAWSFVLILIFCVTGFLAGWVLFVGSEGLSEESSGTNVTRKPDHQIKWKLFDLQETAYQNFKDLSTFYLKSQSIESQNKANTLTRQALFVTGGVLCCLTFLQLLWLILACCVSCGADDGDEDLYLYVSPEQQKFDDWITGEPGYGIKKKRDY